MDSLEKEGNDNKNSMPTTNKMELKIGKIFPFYL
jgi:hypothetical protein